MKDLLGTGLSTPGFLRGTGDSMSYTDGDTRENKHLSSLPLPRGGSRGGKHSQLRGS